MNQPQGSCDGLHGGRNGTQKQNTAGGADHAQKTAAGAPVVLTIFASLKCVQRKVKLRSDLASHQDHTHTYYDNVSHRSRTPFVTRMAPVKNCSFTSKSTPATTIRPEVSMHSIHRGRHEFRLDFEGCRFVA